MTDLVCAVDVGTSAVRAAFVAADGAIAASARRPRTAGGAEFDADVLTADVAAVLAEVCGQSTGSRIAAVAVAGHVGTVMTDAAGSPVCPAAGWSDARGVEALTEAWAGTDHARTVGRPVLTGGALPLSIWLRRHRPDVHDRVRVAYAPKDHLVRQLTGVTSTDTTSAAYALAFDVRDGTWAEHAIRAAGEDPGVFPPALPPTEVAGTVTAAAAAATGLREGTPVVAGGPDGTVGVALLAGLRTDAVVDVAGTTDVVMRVLDDASGVTDGVAVLNPYVVSGRWACGGPTGMTGGAVAHVCGLLGVPDLAAAFDRYGAELAGMLPGADGLVAVPLLSGSRFPDWDPAERAALVGLSERHGSAHVLRAMTEAAGFVVRGAVDELAGGDETVLLAGGAARTPELARLRADVLGRPVLACDEPDVSLRGAAALACIGAGLHEDLATATAAMAPGGTLYRPDPDRAARYRALYGEWQELRRALRAVR